MEKVVKYQNVDEMMALGKQMPIGTVAIVGGRRYKRKKDKWEPYDGLSIAPSDKPSSSSTAAKIKGEIAKGDEYVEKIVGLIRKGYGEKEAVYQAIEDAGRFTERARQFGLDDPLAGRYEKRWEDKIVSAWKESPKSETNADIGLIQPKMNEGESYAKEAVRRIANGEIKNIDTIVSEIKKYGYQLEKLGMKEEDAQDLAYEWRGWIEDVFYSVDARKKSEKSPADRIRGYEWAVETTARKWKKDPPTGKGLKGIVGATLELFTRELRNIGVSEQQVVKLTDEWRSKLYDSISDKEEEVSEYDARTNRRRVKANNYYETEKVVGKIRTDDNYEDVAAEGLGRIVYWVNQLKEAGEKADECRDLGISYELEISEALQARRLEEKEREIERLEKERSERADISRKQDEGQIVRRSANHLLADDDPIQVRGRRKP